MGEISKNIVSLIVSKEFYKAKMLIHEAMNNKLGILLEEKLSEYAPTLYEGEDTDRQAETKKIQGNEWTALMGKLSQIQAEKQAKAAADAKVREVQNGDPVLQFPQEIKDPKTGNVQIGPNGGINTPESNITLGGINTPESNTTLKDSQGVRNIEYYRALRDNTDKANDEPVSYSGVSAGQYASDADASGASVTPIAQRLPIAVGGTNNDETERRNREAYEKYLAKYELDSGASESPVAERVFKTGKDMTNVATTAWLANETKVLDGLGRVLPVVKKLPIAPAIFPAIVAGEALMTAADIATNPDWKDNKLKAIGDAADDVAHKGVRLLALTNPVTGIPSYFDQAFNGGRATDWVTDTIIKHGNIVADPISRVVADTLVGTAKSSQDLKAERDQRKAERDLRRRGVTQQDIEKPPVAAGTVRNGSGQIMHQ